MFRIITFTMCSFLLFSFSNPLQLNPQEAKKITFPASDGILISADLYFVNDSLPYMILCHQAGYSRAEYAETASKFCHLGYNCLAIDQR